MEQNSDLVSLFPYQIKDVNNFYFRDHPVNLNPDTLRYQNYWGKTFLPKCIEGHWVYDKKADEDKGTWVFMMPKLFFYTNHCKIVDKRRRPIYPHLRDNEWIIFTYVLCVEGFSGFEDDENYTCNELINKFEKDPESLSEYEVRAIPVNCIKADGTYKKYIEPWYYLTQHYLLDKPAEKPLGRPLYDNPRHNACILSARGVGKSFTIFIGVFLHEFLFSGVKIMSEIGLANSRLLFGLGSGKAPQLTRSINNVRAAYSDMPGQYIYRDPNRDKCMGAFYKKTQGTWQVGKDFSHIIKRKGGAIDSQGSSVQMVALTADRTTVGAGDRFRYILVEEFGFLSNAISVHSANNDSLISEGERVGSAFYLGTSGDMEAVREPKAMFENPEGYDIFSIPNYWKNINKKIGLFISHVYSLGEFKDPNGNTNVPAALNAVMKKRAYNLEVKDSKSYDEDVMYNPVNPDEMLRPTNNSYLPKQEAQAQINLIEAYDLFKKKAQIGRLSFNPLEKTGVKWEKDMKFELRPILDLKIDDETTNLNKAGAVIIYEQPVENPPPYLYWAVYDPAAKSGEGQSFHSVLIYKHFYSGPERSMEDTIVAEWIGRKDTLDENYEEVIKLAKYYNATIFTEVNVAGFVEWCRRVPQYSNMLEGDAYQLEMEINKNASRNWYKVGTNMDGRKKEWCLKKLRDWLMEGKHPDPDTGIPAYRVINRIYSLRILNEIVAYTDKKHENYDHVSSLLLLMLLLGKIEGNKPVDLSEKETKEVEFDYEKFLTTPAKSQRAAFLNY